MHTNAAASRSLLLFGLLVIAAITLVVAPMARAHDVPRSEARIEMQGAQVRVDLRINLLNLRDGGRGRFFRCFCRALAEQGNSGKQAGCRQDDQPMFFDHGGIVQSTRRFTFTAFDAQRARSKC